MREIPDLIEAVTRPQTNFESNDTISIIGAIISILILLKRFHLQYIERNSNTHSNTSTLNYVSMMPTKHPHVKLA